MQISALCWRGFEPGNKKRNRAQENEEFFFSLIRILCVAINIFALVAQATQSRQNLRIERERKEEIDKQKQ